MELPQENKERIRSEELYRQEFRLELQKEDEPKGCLDKLLELANSPLVIWFLSSIILASITWRYAQYTTRKKEEKQTQTSIFRLDTEMRSRLYYMATEINPDDTENSNLSQVLLVIEKPTFAAYPIGVFLEHEKRNMRSLLWELHSLVSIDEKEEIWTALNLAFELRKIYEEALNEAKASIPTLGETREKDIVEPFATLERRESDLLLQLVSKKFKGRDLRIMFKPFDLKRWGEPFSQEWVKTKSG